jgi:hypothetical protein
MCIVCNSLNKATSLYFQGYVLGCDGPYPFFARAWVNPGLQDLSDLYTDIRKVNVESGT